MAVLCLFVHDNQQTVHDVLLISGRIAVVCSRRTVKQISCSVVFLMLAELQRTHWRIR